MAKGILDHNVDLEILSYNTSKHYVDLDLVNDSIYQTKRTYTYKIDNKLNFIAAFKNLFTRESYHVTRFIDQGMEDFIRKEFYGKKFDVIQFEGLFTAPYLNVLKEVIPDAKMVLRQHNIEYSIWERLSTTASGFKKAYLTLLAKRLKVFEHQAFKKFDAIVPISEVDEAYVNKTGYQNTFVSPTGVVLDQFEKVEIEEEVQSVGFIGSLDWAPNQEGVLWFCEKVWPIVFRENPNAVFTIAGKNPSEIITKLNDPDKGILIAGEVESAVKFMKTKEVLVVPLLSGSGMRIKIIEAMAAQRAIVTTIIGAEGISVGDTCKVANLPQQFAKQVLELLNNKDERILMGRNSHSLVKECYSNYSQVNKLLDFYKNLI
jgi:glycosyltransferase involved in cell wall biosynthesis